MTSHENWQFEIHNFTKDNTTSSVDGFSFNYSFQVKTIIIMIPEDVLS